MFNGDPLHSGALSALVSEAAMPYLAEVLQTRIDAAPADLHHAFNKNQIASKKWLLDEVRSALGGRFGTVYVLGGWYGVLGAMLLSDRRLEIDRVLSFDLDPQCAPVAERINRAFVAQTRFRAITADARTVDYDRLGAKRANGKRPSADREAPDLVINTSCEHMPCAAEWYDRVPLGMLQAHQSNDYFDCPEHVNCVADLEAFKAQLPMSELRYEGALARRRYSRFMLIGRK